MFSIEHEPHPRLAVRAHRGRRATIVAAAVLVTTLGSTLAVTAGRCQTAPAHARQTVPGNSGTAAGPANADQLLTTAMEAQERGDYPAAIRDYRKVLSMRPTEVEARVNLGAALVHAGQIDDGIAEYKAALPNLALKDPVLLDLGLAYYKKQDFRDAREQFEALHRSQPENVRVAILLGYTDLGLGDGASAVATLQPLEERNSTNLELEYVLGSAMINAGSRADGVTRIERVAASSHSAEAYRLAGSTLLSMNDYEPARRDLDQALLIDPKQPGLYSQAGIARDKVGDLEHAETAFRAALKANPNDFDANLYLGAMLYKRRDLDEARGYLDRALQLNPKSSMAIYESAMLKSNSGQLESAVADLEKLAAAEPDWLEPHVALTSLYYRVHRPEDGAKERAIVERLTAAEQAKGPVARRP